jgi:hypothetical protein
MSQASVKDADRFRRGPRERPRPRSAVVLLGPPYQRDRHGPRNGSPHVTAGATRSVSLPMWPFFAADVPSYDELRYSEGRCSSRQGNRQVGRPCVIAQSKSLAAKPALQQTRHSYCCAAVCTRRARHCRAPGRFALCAEPDKVIHGSEALERVLPDVRERDDSDGTAEGSSGTACS